MQNDTHLLYRRSFLKLTAGVAAVTATGHLPMASAQTESPSRRSAPVDPVRLRSSKLEVILDRVHGLPFEYELLPSRARIAGEHSGASMAASMYSTSTGEVTQSPVTVKSVKASAAQADFACTVSLNAAPVSAFVIRYALDGATLSISMEDVVESSGFELIDVRMPSLVSIRMQDGGGWIAHGEDGGDVAELSSAKNAALPANTFWGNVLATLPVLMVGNRSALCVQEIESFMDGANLAVSGEGPEKVAFSGTHKVHRVNGRLCYDMNTGPGTPKNCGTQQTPNLLVGQRSVCRLDFLPAAGDPLSDWLSAAKLVRARMPRIPTHYYDDKVVYGIRCDEPSYKQPTATFADCQNLIAKIAALTDRAPQVVHLWGWQYRGKDTGYPAVAEVNQRIGGYDAMMKLLADARAFNANVTLSDNYDDAYRSSPEWDEAIVARRPDGELWKSRNWTGEDSYVLGMAKYAKKKALDRVRFTCERYRMKETTHVDVLSYFPIRNDWDRSMPASGYKNLVEGRYPIFDEFARHGIDVSSEALRYAFIGKMSCFWYMQGPRPCPFGGKAVPMLPLIYRQSAIWGQSGNRSFLDRLLISLFYNACAHMIVRADMADSEITDYFYLMMTPWFQVRGRNIETFRRDGERTQIGLENNGLIDIDWESKKYSVTLGDAVITRDQALTCPLDRDRIAFYSVQAQQLSYPLPSGWKSTELVASTITGAGREPAEATVTAGTIHVTVAERRPVIVYRNKALADRKL